MAGETGSSQSSIGQFFPSQNSQAEPHGTGDYAAEPEDSAQMEVDFF